jgi:hypothetical protein
MGKYATLGELKAVAKAYCKKMGYEFIFANDYKFGFMDKNEQLWTMSYFELEEALKGSK